MVRPGWLTTAFAGILLGALPGAWAEEVYIYRLVSELTIVDGRLPARPDPAAAAAAAADRGPGRGSQSVQLRAATQPYVSVEGTGEAYLGRAVKNAAEDNGPAPVAQLDGVLPDDVVAFRLDERREITGRLFAPRDKDKEDDPGMVVVTFKAVPPPAQQDDARAVFARARRQHYQRLLDRGVPGSVWFGQQVREADALLSPTRPGPVAAAGPGSQGPSGLEQTFDLFSGERAINENLQLDRPLTPNGNVAANLDRAKTGAAARVRTESLTGITVAEVDWTARLKGKTPALDPLASTIPADQHAVFVPSLKAASVLLAEFHGEALPLARLFEPHAEDSLVQTRYERQLGISLADLAGFAGARAIRGLAVTGSDPYLPSGTDVAVLIETEAADDLAGFLKSRLDAARRTVPEAQDAAGTVEGVDHAGARTADRRLSSYIATLGQVVVVTNSTAQLSRLARTARGQAPRLSEQAEYRFFRDRYPRGDAAESAFLIVTDATIRRWCGPRWRIGSSRRVRAAAALAQLQAANLGRIVSEPKQDAALRPPAGSLDLGALHLTRRGTRSEIYGTLTFQTPIVELSLDEVERDEADAYARWREAYQTNWRGVFDPIAVRIAAGPDRLAADVSVIPLIVGSDYRPLLELAGNARIAPEAGDRHPGSLLHAILALDVQSTLFRQGNDQLAALTRVPQQVALGWLGRSASAYLDDDPFWKELAATTRPDTFVSTQINRLPLGLNVEVTDGIKLALFLSGLRAFVDQSAPNLTSWENKQHQGQRYVRVAEAEGAPANPGRPRFALYYFSTPRSLTLSPNEDVVRRAIDRHVAKTKGQPEPPPWLGPSLALQVSRQGLDVLSTSGLSANRERLQVLAWSNLPILNEWKRLFPDRDPVALHEQLWGTRPIDPGGGRYVWNPGWATMESTTFSHPGKPGAGSAMNSPLSRFGSVNFGLGFEDGGLRARAEVELTGKP